MRTFRIATISNVGKGGSEIPFEFSQNFPYSGKIEALDIPETGIYFLEAWGAEAGDLSTEGQHATNAVKPGKGGYSYGYARLNKGDKIYIVVGGKPQTSAAFGNECSAFTYAGGYNGGGNGEFIKSGSPWVMYAAGGGATHFAKVSGLLSSIGYDSFVTAGNGLLVAAGGGGATQSIDWPAQTSWSAVGSNCHGGYGGGLEGGKGNSYTGQSYWPAQYTDPATQTSGYAFGKGQTGCGGGLYGGSLKNYGQTLVNTSGGGGSSYIGGVTDITISGEEFTKNTESNNNSGNGKAKITYITK